MKRFLPKTLAFWMLLACPVAAAAEATHLGTEELLLKADLVVLGETVSVDQGVDTTRGQVRILQLIKGPSVPGGLVTVEALGGKVFIDESQPTFAHLQTDLFFLQNTGPGTYACVNRADGQKTVRGRNIYPYHDNIAYSVPLKDYLKGLEAALKAVQASGQAERP